MRLVSQRARVVLPRLHEVRAREQLRRSPQAVSTRSARQRQLRNSDAVSKSSDWLFHQMHSTLARVDTDRKIKTTSFEKIAGYFPSMAL